MDRPDRRRDVVSEQYADASNLNARAALHARFSTCPVDWPIWVFDAFHLPDRCHVLEIGCGTGRLWAANIERVSPDWEITLTDASPGMLDEARKGLGELSRAFDFRLADAQELPFDTGAFDAVIANHMLYHAPDVAKALAEIRRVLKPGGRFHTTTNGIDHLRELRELAAAVAPDLPFAGNSVVRSFSLENGAAQLQQRFENVELRLCSDGLAVTEPRPLVDYILSCARSEVTLTDAQVDELNRLARERVEATGCFRITKSSGMFVATCPRGGAGHG